MQFNKQLICFIFLLQIVTMLSFMTKHEIQVTLQKGAVVKTDGRHSLTNFILSKLMDVE